MHTAQRLVLFDLDVEPIGGCVFEDRPRSTARNSSCLYVNLQIDCESVDRSGSGRPIGGLPYQCLLLPYRCEMEAVAFTPLFRVDYPYSSGSAT